MISLPSDFTAAPVLPLSGIAPKELIGNANFPQLLGGFQSGAEKGQKISAPQGAGLEAGSGIGLGQPIDGMPLAMPPSGKPLPQSGTALPLGQNMAPSDSAGFAVTFGENRGGTDQGWIGLNSPPAAATESEAVDVDLPASIALPFSQAQGGFESGIRPPDVGLPLEPASEPSFEEIPGREGVLAPSPIEPAAVPRETHGEVQPENRRERPQSTEVNTVPTRMASGENVQAAALDNGTERSNPALAEAATPQREGKLPQASSPEPPLSSPALVRSPEPGPIPTSIEAEGSRARQAMVARSTTTIPLSNRGLGGTRPLDLSSEAETRPAANLEQPVQLAANMNAQALTNERPIEELAPQAQPSQSAIGVPNAAVGARPVRNDQRGQTDLAASRVLSAPSDVMQAAAVNAVQRAVVDMGDAEVDPDLPRAPLPAAASNGSENSAQAPAQTPAQPLAQPPAHSPSDTAAPQTPTPQLAAAPAVSQTSAPAPIVDTTSGARPSPQLESAIEQLAETRSAAQANKPELTVRHQEFGAITMRLETTAGDLRATLSARDPGFVPAIQAALADRSVAASSETASGNTNRGNDQAGSNPNSQTGQQSSNFAGSHGHAHGWGFGGAYGSSTGSGQGTSQPYSGQTEGRDEESGSNRAGRGLNGGNGSEGDGEIFA